MNRIGKLIVIVAIVGLAVCNAKQLFGELNIPAEPGQDKVLHRYMKPQLRAFIIVYDLNNDGVADYMTQRQIGQNYSVISKHPIFYGMDFDGDGSLDKNTEVFVDPTMDGLNGNEISWVEWEEMQKNVES